MFNKIVKKLFNFNIYCFAIILFFVFNSTNANASINYNFDGFLSDLENEIVKESLENDDTFINHINVKSNTGENYAEAGEIINGEASTSINIKTSVNGDVIEDVEIEEKKAGNVEVNVESKVDVREDKAIIETTTEINGEEKKEIKEIEINNFGDKIEKNETSFEESKSHETVLNDEILETENLNKTEALDDRQAETEENKLSAIILNVINAIKDSLFNLFSFLV